ncbi:MAG TPA: hypothetical protein VGV38_12975 [Pyrinomonadaceae bacterium]|nr:hypothetical protein [Pyrinomonadaceae bacterium]
MLRSQTAARRAGPATPTRGRVVRALLLVCASLLTAACGEKSVATVSTEADAIEIIDVLRENGFEAEKKEVGEGETRKWSVVIDDGWFGSGTMPVALQVLHDHGLPRPEEPPVESSGFIPSETVERMQQQRKIRVDIERQLRALPGVTHAIVTVVLPPDPTLELNPHPATASALVVYRDPRPTFNEQQVQNMVARSVPGLKPAEVSVTLAQQTPRPVPRRELSARRRNNILLAALIGFVTVLLFVLVVLWLQTRRQRAQLAALRESQEPTGADEASEETPGAALAPVAPNAAGANAPTRAANEAGARPSPNKPADDWELGLSGRPTDAPGGR